MEQSNKNIWVWVVVAVVVVGVVVYLALTGGLSLPKAEEEPQKVYEDQEELARETGVNPISEEGVVVSREGIPAKNDAEPGSPEAPQQSNPVSEGQIPVSAIKITMTAEGISPSEFRVRAGQAVTLGVTSGDTQTHIFAFKEPSLKGVATGLAPGESRLIQFNAPSSKGEYAFYCDVPGHEARGEVGKMIVE